MATLRNVHSTRRPGCDLFQFHRQARLQIHDSVRDWDIQVYSVGRVDVFCRTGGAGGVGDSAQRLQLSAELYVFPGVTRCYGDGCCNPPVDRPLDRRS